MNKKGHQASTEGSHQFGIVFRSETCARRITQSLRKAGTGLQGLIGGRGVGKARCGACTGRRRRQSIPVRSPARRSNMADKTKVAEQYYAPPPDLGKWESLRIFLWNSETGQFLGRTGSSWGKLLFLS